MTQFKHVHEGKNPFMKAGDAILKNKSNPESRNYQATTDFIPNYSSNPSTNRNAISSSADHFVLAFYSLMSTP